MTTIAMRTLRKLGGNFDWIGGGAEASQYNKTLDEILKHEVLRPHRGDFLLNLAYECTPNFGEEFEQYLRQPLVMLSANPDEKVLHIYAKI